MQLLTRAAPLNQLDLGVFKNFRLAREGMHLQFRAELFNAFNHTNFTAANGDFASASFGTIRGTYSPRQSAVRFEAGVLDWGFPNTVRL